MSALSLVERYFAKNGAIGPFGECEDCIFRQTSAEIHAIRPDEITEPVPSINTCDVVHGDVDAYECPAIDELIREDIRQNADEYASDMDLHRELNERSERGR